MDRDHISRIAREVKGAAVELHTKARPSMPKVRVCLLYALRELAPLLKEAAINEREWLAWDQARRVAARW